MGDSSLRPDNVSLWITSYRRLDLLDQTLRDWFASYPFNEVHVLANDPTVDYASVVTRDGYPPIHVHRNPRPPWLVGSIAQSWNIAMLHTFDTRDWCLMSQDDVRVTPGWDELITDDYWTYVAPMGDVIQLQSRLGFNRVGWFDERFRAIGGPEADYTLRMLMTYPDRLSIHDHHPWQLLHNEVGLERYWDSTFKPEGTEHHATWAAHRWRLADVECFERFEQKWGRDVNELMAEQVHLLRAGQPATAERRPGWDELCWYPSLCRRLVELNRQELGDCANVRP